MIKYSPIAAIKMQSSNAKPEINLCIPEIGLLSGARKFSQANNIQMKKAINANQAIGDPSGVLQFYKLPAMNLMKQVFLWVEIVLTLMKHLVPSMQHAP